VEMDQAGELEFRSPDGRVIVQAPPEPRLPDGPVPALALEHTAAGITPDAWTPTPLWQGEPMDYGLALDMLPTVGVPAGTRRGGSGRGERRRPGIGLGGDPECPLDGEEPQREERGDDVWRAGG
jgi:hypothetical protein